jgi:hypothetical protein
MDGGIQIRTLLVGLRTYVFSLDGELDGRTAASLDAELERADGAGRLIVDLLDVTFVDADGLAVLDRPGLVVVADRPALRLIELAGDASGLTVYPTLSAAIADAVAA